MKKESMYEKLYYSLFNDVTDAIDALQGFDAVTCLRTLKEAQRKCEEMYISEKRVKDAVAFSHRQQKLQPGVYTPGCDFFRIRIFSASPWLPEAGLWAGQDSCGWYQARQRPLRFAI